VTLTLSDKINYFTAIISVTQLSTYSNMTDHTPTDTAAQPTPVQVPTQTAAAPEAPTFAPDVKQEPAPEVKEPQNALTQKFTEAEWKALKEFRVGHLSICISTLY